VNRNIGIGVVEDMIKNIVQGKNLTINFKLHQVNKVKRRYNHKNKNNFKIF